MNKKMKKQLYRIIISGILLLFSILVDINVKIRRNNAKYLQLRRIQHERTVLKERHETYQINKRETSRNNCCKKIGVLLYFFYLYTHKSRFKMSIVRSIVYVLYIISIFALPSFYIPPYHP